MHPKSLMNAHIKQTFQGCLKERLFKCKSSSAGHLYIRNDKEKRIIETITFHLTFFLSKPVCARRYEIVHDIIDPIIGKYYPDYLNEPYDFTISYVQRSEELLEKYKDMHEQFVNEDDFLQKVDLLRDYIIDSVLPTMNKFDDLVYLEKFIRDLNEKDKTSYLGFLHSFNQYQFHIYKYMTICKLVNVPDFEQICQKEYEFLKMIYDSEPNYEKYIYLLDVYHDLKKKLDQL